MSKNTIVRASAWDDVYLIHTQDGSDTLYSRKFQAAYHSLFGAVTESRHVCIQFGLNEVRQVGDISILEFGFGTGLNAFLAYLFSQKHQQKVLYTGIEAFPIDPVVAEKLDYPGYLAHPEERDIFLQMHHDVTFSQDLFHFRRFPSINDIPDTGHFTCVFFDAFSPGIQSEPWEQSMFDILYGVMAKGGILVTYSAQGEVRRRMIKAGFSVERLPGPPGKREMLRGRVV